MCAESTRISLVLHEDKSSCNDILENCHEEHAQELYHKEIIIQLHSEETEQMEIYH